MDLEQAQHGHGLQSGDVEQAAQVCRAVLLVRRLQLGLEPAARRPNLSSAEPRSRRRSAGRLWPNHHDDARAARLSYRRMVSFTQLLIFFLPMIVRFRYMIDTVSLLLMDECAWIYLLYEKVYMKKFQMCMHYINVII